MLGDKEAVMLCLMPFFNLLSSGTFGTIIQTGHAGTWRILATLAVAKFPNDLPQHTLATTGTGVWAHIQQATQKLHHDKQFRLHESSVGTQVPGTAVVRLDLLDTHWSVMFACLSHSHGPQLILVIPITINVISIVRVQVCHFIAGLHDVIIFRREPSWISTLVIMLSSVELWLHHTPFPGSYITSVCYLYHMHTLCSCCLLSLNWSWVSVCNWGNWVQSFMADCLPQLCTDLGHHTFSQSATSTNV